ncbi:leucine--tRNA ligase [Candidatus Saccharibacteria bacterium RIFCSPHIGHO2_01_FULL_45_15]|nr:MAG: leucine--tRNA ligase [Candidatus Saccharibacteria bacterium RIFCSPHIGHO2_01_FULL_45_15]OGL27590.1 MAG: leucine--tRNA ligase [Candidatus Saccharibacteria bacterium RIFCSPHIGHO2_02_FULL_46_12]OGL31626.1 MAG: leucine--tRNA ligase [Candidatus Saccharibacteria bacterium RIFCSPHIGHO2_12_FULL_44_22]
MKRYNPTEIEKKWQEIWDRDGTYVVDLHDHSKPKYLGFSMLPGITGAGIHIGHGRTFQFSDIKVRAKRQQGYNAYHPIGWDSFGLPVENYAIKIGKKPRDAHDDAKANFIRQLKRLGYSYDWTKEISTADPRYYKWTQWVFTQLYKNDLAYQKQSPQWWCEHDQTVLANEQVEGGNCWRCGNPVVKKNLKQWFFRITAYADEMLDATDDLNWTDMVKTMQKNWIGKSQGAEVTFAIDGSDQQITVFTTRPDTLFGATFLVLAPEHELAKQLTNNDTRDKVVAYIDEAARKSEIERMNESRDKTGVFTGSHATNPVTGEKIPIWIADYALASYGTGALMAVPAHDERDFAFAEKFKLPIVNVIERPESDSGTDMYHGEGVLTNSGHFDGMRSEEAREEVVAWLEQLQLGRSKITYKMRDWLISRQRYWGAPIPIVHVDGHGAMAVADDQLPVVLPDVDDYKPKGGAVSVLAGVEDWVHVWFNIDTTETVPFNAGKPDGDNWYEGHRETDTMDGYACSSWYFLRYIDPFNDTQAWDPELAKQWQPVDFYNGGDHAVAHLLYSRFWMRFFYKQGLVPDPEPFKRMMYNGFILAPDGQKMSKSKGNVIDPLEIMDSGYGADSLRVYEMFIAPYDLDAPWDTRGVPGTYRFLNRAWTLVQEYLSADAIELSDDAARQILTVAHKTTKKVTEDIEDDKFNTAVSAMMEAVNNYYKLKESFGIGKSDAWQTALEALLQVLAPFAPHITEELWADLGHADTIHVDHWPTWDDSYLVSDVATIIVQVNGKLRAKLQVAKDATGQEVEQLALHEGNVSKFIGDKKPAKIIYVPGRLINIVVAG